MLESVKKLDGKWLMEKIKKLLVEIKEQDAFSDDYDVDHRVLKLIEAIIVKIEEIDNKIGRGQEKTKEIGRKYG